MQPAATAAHIRNRGSAMLARSLHATTTSASAAKPGNVNEVDDAVKGLLQVSKWTREPVDR